MWRIIFRKYTVIIQLLTPQIYAEDVNFFNYRLPRCLGQACEQANFNKAYPYAYPPKFAIEVSSRDATRASVMELRFKGAHRELSTQIQLHPLRSEFN